MPQYSFAGITLNGNTVKGVREAHSKSHLQEILLKENIALISHNEKKPYSITLSVLFRKKINDQVLSVLFQYLASLLKRGVPLITTLEFFVKQPTHQNLKPIIFEIMLQVTKGVSFATALKNYPDTFSPFMVQLIESGERTGNLDHVLDEAAVYLRDRYTFKKKLISAALFPIITLLFSLCIFSIIFIGIVPQFETLFATIEKPIPASTQRIIWISQLIQSKWILLFIALGTFFIITLRMASKIESVKKMFEKILLRLPIIGPCYQITSVVGFLKSIHIFIKAGFSLKKACESSLCSVQNKSLKESLSNALLALNHGNSLSIALQENAKNFFDINTIGLISIGEQSGNLEGMLNQSIYQLEQQLNDNLTTISSIIQPLLLIGVGLLIAIILIITYLPIFSLATIMH